MVGFNKRNVMTKNKILPTRVEIEFSNHCNSNCQYCPRQHIKDVPLGHMDINLFKRIIDELEEYPNIVLQLHRRGESLLHPKFNSMIRYLEKKSFKLQLATNAILLNEELSDLLAGALYFISFSIDHPMMYSKSRGIDCYTKVENNILDFLKINNGRTRTQVSMVETDSTSAKVINEFVLLWRKKVDRVRIYQEHSKNGKYGSLSIKRKSEKKCVKPFTDIVIFYDGQIARCNHDWQSPPMGNLNQKTIIDVFNNDNYCALRKQHLDSNITDELCKNCESWYAEESVQGTGLVFEK
jgi:radical SAM protein with 4Fe4S-binding SPASM domain